MFIMVNKMKLPVAIELYKTQKLSLGKASELADPSRRFCNLEVNKIESIDSGSIREFSYTYHSFISYIPPPVKLGDLTCVAKCDIVQKE